MDGFLLFVSIASNLYVAVGKSHGNKNQCKLVEKRVRCLMAELDKLSSRKKKQFATSPTGNALAETLQAAVEVCGQFEKKSDWLKSVFSASRHAARFEDLHDQLDHVVADAAFSASLGAGERQEAQEKDAAEARALLIKLQEEQQVGFSNVMAGQGECEWSQWARLSLG